MKKMIFLLSLAFSNLFATLEYLPGQGNEVLVGEKADITLLNWNILGLPNDQVAVRPWEERLDGIADKILSTDADLVILQECFEKNLSLALYEKLKNTYAHIYLHLDAQPTPLPSGLALFSKLPISHFRFTPHPDLLDTERNAKMGTIDFLFLNRENLPVAHIAASHFQGSSNCEWRVGLTEDKQRLSYAEVREQEALAALNLFTDPTIPHYLCGDLNVDRRSSEFNSSTLNVNQNPALTDPMPAPLKLVGTNTNFWKHEKGLSKMYPTLSQKQTISLALQYQALYQKQLKSALSKDPWTQPLSAFNPSYFSALQQELHLSSPEEKMVWEYFKEASVKAILKEKELWRGNQNPGEAPPVSIGRVIEIRALPIEESLDYILGTNRLAGIKEVTILKGYEDSSAQNTLSDHHPVMAKIRVAQPTD